MSEVWIGLLLCIFVTCVYVDKSNHSSSSRWHQWQCQYHRRYKGKSQDKNASAAGKTNRIASNLEVCVFLLVGVMTDAGA